ncbi:hypothetical protein ACFVY1_43420 [Streptomyces sp. NPDC058293]|uniref:hypothetical protein n=1 Tax=Streptomyces sp. NPDC058293 TaxID=3346429 RepID=UPI0036E16A4F
MVSSGSNAAVQVFLVGFGLHQTQGGDAELVAWSGGHVAGEQVQRLVPGCEGLDGAGV